MYLVLRADPSHADPRTDPTHDCFDMCAAAVLRSVFVFYAAHNLGARKRCSTDGTSCPSIVVWNFCFASRAARAPWRLLLLYFGSYIHPAHLWVADVAPTSLPRPQSSLSGHCARSVVCRN